MRNRKLEIVLLEEMNKSSGGIAKKDQGYCINAVLVWMFKLWRLGWREMDNQ